MGFPKRFIFLFFQGRTNKLVDGCYSFWQAAVFPILEVAQLAMGNKISLSFDGKALQEYILVACQDMENGGLRDKPDKFVLLFIICRRKKNLHYFFF